MNKITNEQLDSLIKSAVNSSGPLPPDDKFLQIISALRELRELRAAMLQGADGNSPVIPEGWQVEAERMAEMHGMSFVLFRHGEAPQCADPTKVVISFTDKGLGHDTEPQNAPQNSPEIIPGGLVEAVNNLLNNDGSRGCYDAMECGTAREKIELWLAQRQRWDEQRKANLYAGNSPVIPEWIPVSERMPPSRHEVLVGRWWGEKPRWCCKWATYIPGHPDAQSSGWLIPGASWTPTHWMPLPAAPQEVKGE